MKGIIKNRNKGFSLVELIVVIAIMVILVAMLVPGIVGYVKKTHLAAARNTASVVYKAAQHYVVTAIGDGEQFTPNQEIDVEILWSPGVELLKPMENPDNVTIVLDDTGTVVDYVFYVDNLGNEADYPEGQSGRIAD